MGEPSSSTREECMSSYDGSGDWYLVLCLGGLQAIVKTEIERCIAESGYRVNVTIFKEDCRGAPALFDDIHHGQAGCGKLLVTTDASPKSLASLRCVQGLFALVAHSASLDIGLPATQAADTGGEGSHLRDTAATSTSESLRDVSKDVQAESPTEAALARLESLVTDADLWPAAVNVWKRFKQWEAETAAAEVTSTPNDIEEAIGHAVLGQPGQTSIEDGQTSHAVREIGIDVTSLKFRASVVRDGQHPFSSVEASPRLGGAVWSVNRGWTVDLKGYDVEVVVMILQRSVVVGLALDGDRTKRCSHGRIPKEDKGFLETGERLSSLRPSTAYLMLRMAEPTVGDIIVDSMCGVGTIPFLGAGWFPGVSFVGGEVDDIAVQHLRRNAEVLRRSSLAPPEGASGAACACAWDAQSLPLRDGSVDAMVVDMPFGHSCGTPRQNAKLYPLVMAEMARVLRPGSGRAVLLVAQPHLLGVPGLERDNRKDRKKLRKKGRKKAGEGVGSHEQEGNQAAAPSGDPDSCKRGADGMASSRPVGRSTGSRGSNVGGNSGPGDGAKNDGVSPAVSRIPASPPPDQGAGGVKHQQERDSDSAAVPQGLWRIKSRRTVNVGGLVSSLLILDRTKSPSPIPRVDRRKRLVGLDAYCKRRTDGSGDGNVQPS
ncbi:unnamed protein product [Scytosiphon promiscuus]